MGCILMGGLSRSGSTEKPGDLKMVALNAVPLGWIKANGAAVSRSAYAALFTAIGTLYGAGDGATTFNLPDLRGEFLRGFDDARGVDSGRVFGSAQAANMAAHTHSTRFVDSTAGGGVSGVVDAYRGANNPATLTSPTTSVGVGVDTRPRNVAMLAVIKY